LQGLEWGGGSGHLLQVEPRVLPCSWMQELAFGTLLGKGRLQFWVVQSDHDLGQARIGGGVAQAKSLRQVERGLSLAARGLRTLDECGIPVMTGQAITLRRSAR